jgi:hypothetical protein
VLGTRDLDIHVALGHGRSYGLSSRVLFRSLPPILESGIWPALDCTAESEFAPRRPTYAVLTDLGNDIGYGVRPETLLGWTEECIHRLRAMDAQIVLTSLPRGRLRRLHDWEIQLTRRLMFPSCGLQPGLLRERIAQVDAGLETLAKRHGLGWFEASAEWYGFDPMHVRRRSRAEYWHGMLAGFGNIRETQAKPGSWFETLRLLARPPNRRWLFGVERNAEQLGWSSGGSRLYLY